MTALRRVVRLIVPYKPRHAARPVEPAFDLDMTQPFNLKDIIR